MVKTQQDYNDIVMTGLALEQRRQAGASKLVAYAG